METHTLHLFETIHTEGGLLPADLLQRILDGDKGLGGLDPESYHLTAGETIRETVTRSWNRMRLAWDQFKTARGKLKPGETGTTETRERWLLRLFEELGYGRLRATPEAVVIEGKSYPVSHRLPALPIHLVGCNIKLDERSAGVSGAARSSPHSMLQELLNREQKYLWGIVSNGLTLRVLRDNASLTRQAFLEFDLESMFEGQVFSDFLLFWLVCHASRLSGDTPANFWLEHWSQTAQKEGVRAWEGLRLGVEEALQTLGSGFLTHPANQSLRGRLQHGELSKEEYYHQLLRLAYRLIFLFTAEDRDLLLHPQAGASERQAYRDYYSARRLRRLALRQRGSRHGDLWQGLRLVMEALGNPQGCPQLVLPGLGSYLFSSRASDPNGVGAIPDLEEAQLDNQALLGAVRALTATRAGRTRRLVDYKNMGAEELGSVYESLLELHPNIDGAGCFELKSVAGSERKTTGSYYTPSSLIQVLLDSALEPVIEQALDQAKEVTTKDAKGTKESGQKESIVQAQEQALLNLKICDPACGSGHFLIAAAYRLAARLARLRSGEAEPAPEALRQALRQVIAHCIYGVDINPLAVELAKVNLWLESLEPGKPLSFLDAHIQCGDSLVGVGPGLDIREIPDEAFNPAFGDDKATASALKKRNKRERGGQLGFRWDSTTLEGGEDIKRWRAERAAQIEAMPEDDPVQVQAKAQGYAEFQQTSQYIQNRLEYDLWTAAFFWPIPKGDAERMLAPTQQELTFLRMGKGLDERLVEQVRRLAKRLRYFHWEVAFPTVFSGENPGFDCVLGNPPWETTQLREDEFFASIEPSISILIGDKRKQAIERLKKLDDSLYSVYSFEKKNIENLGNFYRHSNRYNLTAVGKINTYAIFTELNQQLTGRRGDLGIIVKSGIATDSNTQLFFSSLLRQKKLVSFFDFENRPWLFQDVATAGVRFCLLTISTRAKEKFEFAFFCTQTQDLSNPIKRMLFSEADIKLFNPNTHNLPAFTTKIDYELNHKIYQKAHILEDETSGQNPWSIYFKQGLFNMTSDSRRFIDKYSMNEVRLYEPRMIHQYDHRWACYEGEDVVEVTESDKKTPNFYNKSRYWINPVDVKAELPEGYNYQWLLGFRNITRPTEIRTVIFSVLPLVGVGHNMPLVFFKEYARFKLLTSLICNLNSVVLDYAARFKVTGASIDFFRLRQLPVLSPSAYTRTDIDFITPRVLELIYTAYDLKHFADDVWKGTTETLNGNEGAESALRTALRQQWQANRAATCGGHAGLKPPPGAEIGPDDFPYPPFKWDEERRALLRAELDAYYAKLYGLTRNELRYILDPQEVFGPDFPGETFRVLKDKEIRQYGEYRTRRLVLEAWDRLFGIGSEEGSVIIPPEETFTGLSFTQRYEVETRPLGRGGQAEVYAARNRQSGERVALKRLLPEYLDSEHAIERLKHEVQAQGLVQHPNVMPIIDYGDDFTWYSMPLAVEVLSNRSLPIAEGELLEIITQLCQGLAVAHAQGNIHRDIKPENILLIDTPPYGRRWVLSDWGLVRQEGLTADGFTKVAGNFGSQGYAPPEFEDNPHLANPSADVYSLGRVIARALTGKQLRTNIPLLPEQPGWRELVRDMTALEIEERIQTIEEVLTRLKKIKEGSLPG